MSKAVDIFSGILFVRTRHYDDVKKVVVLQGNKPERRFFEKQPQGEWISVSERLPDDREDTYWVCTDGEYQCQCRWTDANTFWAGRKTDWHWCLFDIPQYQKVVAWQELPEPYKKGGAE